MTAHAPRPWRVRHAKGKANRAIFDANDRHIITVRPIKTAAAIQERGSTKKLARFVVDAVHGRDELLDALKSMRALFSGDHEFRELYQDQASVALEKADKILAKAKEAA